MKVTKAELEDFYNSEWSAQTKDGEALPEGSLHLSDEHSLLDEPSTSWPETIDSKEFDEVSVELDPAAGMHRGTKFQGTIGGYTFKIPEDWSVDFNSVLRGWLKQKRKTSTSYICEVGVDNLAAFEEAMKSLNIKIKKV